MADATKMPTVSPNTRRKGADQVRPWYKIRPDGTARNTAQDTCTHKAYAQAVAEGDVNVQVDERVVAMVKVVCQGGLCRRKLSRVSREDGLKLLYHERNKDPKYEVANDENGLEGPRAPVSNFWRDGTQ